jgi:hypothetical protein
MMSDYELENSYYFSCAYWKRAILHNGCDKARELLEKMIVELRPSWGSHDCDTQERHLRHYFDQGLELALPVVHLRYKLLQREAAKEEQRCADRQRERNAERNRKKREARKRSKQQQA